MSDANRVDNREEEEKKGSSAWLGKAVTALKLAGRGARKVGASKNTMILAAYLLVAGLLLSVTPLAGFAVPLMLSGAGVGAIAFGCQLSEKKRAREHEQAQEQKREQKQEAEARDKHEFNSAVMQALNTIAEASRHNQTSPVQDQNQRSRPHQPLVAALAPGAAPPPASTTGSIQPVTQPIVGANQARSASPPPSVSGSEDRGTDYFSSRTMATAVNEYLPSAPTKFADGPLPLWSDVSSNPGDAPAKGWNPPPYGSSLSSRSHGGKGPKH